MQAINKIVKLIISIESIIISSMIPLFIPVPSFKNIFKMIEIPINWQIPVLIFLTLFFSGELVIKAFTIYIFLGLFLFPVFYDGGSLGYLLTPNFGYLIGIYPLIMVINILNKNKKNDLLKSIYYSTIGIIIMHLTGILYFSLNLILFNKANLILYNIGKYSLSKISFHILMIIPVIVLLKILKKLNI